MNYSKYPLATISSGVLLVLGYPMYRYIYRNIRATEIEELNKRPEISTFNFGLRGAASITIGLLVLVASVILYSVFGFEAALRYGLMFALVLVIVGALLLRANSRIKKGQPPF